MTNEQNLLERTRELAAKLVDGELATEEAEELSQLLRDDEARLGVLADHLLLDSLLSEELGNQSLTALVDMVSDEATESPLPMPETNRFSLTKLTKQFSQYAGWAVAVSLVSLLAIMIFRGDFHSFANAADVVRAALETHTAAIERLYLVQVEQAVPAEAEFTPPRDVQIATQGDRFYVEMNRGERRWFWGRDADGATWLTLGPRRALRIDSAETGPALNYISDLYSLQLESLLNNALKHCAVETTSHSPQTYVITAKPRRTSGVIRGMQMEVDKETKAIRKLIVERQLPKSGRSTVTFTLVDSRTPNEANYRAEGHLTSPYQIYSRDFQPEKRREVLTNWFGTAADRWIISIPQPDSVQELSGDSEQALRGRVGLLFDSLRNGDVETCLKLTDPKVIQSKGRLPTRAFFRAVNDWIVNANVSTETRVVESIYLIENGQAARVDIAVTLSDGTITHGFEIWSLIDGQWYYRETPK